MRHCWICGDWFDEHFSSKYLTRPGLTNRARRRATQQLQTAVERTSSWIRSKVRQSTTAWLNRPPSSLLPYPHPTPLRPHPSPTTVSPHHLHRYPLECIQSIPQHLLPPVTSPCGWSCWRRYSVGYHRKPTKPLVGGWRGWCIGNCCCMLYVSILLMLL